MTGNHFNLLLSATLLGGALLCARHAAAQLPPGLTVEPLAIGSNLQRQALLHAKDGPFDVWHVRLALAPGAELPWHTNPGVSILSLTHGALTEYHSNGCTTLHLAGDVFFESTKDLHKVVNHGAVAVEGLATFIVPAGSPLLIPAAEPLPRPCGPQNGEGAEAIH